jgi:hypothetical protein
LSSLFCRHNRFTAECPICSKGSVLAAEREERRPPAPQAKAKVKAKAKRSGTREPPARTFTGPYVAIERNARVYEVRLEKVPGGLRLAEWRAGGLERSAPVLPASALRDLVGEAAGRSLVSFDLDEQAPDPQASGAAASPGTAGDMREELRVERLDEPGLIRVGRWIYWPGDDRWELQEAPVMLPEGRFEQALAEAARLGLI